MKGHVPTPAAVVDAMVAKLFAGRSPTPEETVLDPGCGDGAFLAGVVRWCRREERALPNLVGVELNPSLVELARRRFAGNDRVQILHKDYLKMEHPADFVIGNPPYVSITGLNAAERNAFRGKYTTAVGRFDLYLLFFERSLHNLRKGGRLCFITPEKFEYVDTAAPLRKLLAATRLEELDHVGEETFDGLTTYPTITTLEKRARGNRRTRVRFRDGSERLTRLPNDGSSWNPAIHASPKSEHTLTLDDLAMRVSCGTATGADEIFVFSADKLPPMLAHLARPTISGRQLGLLREGAPVVCRERMLVPYDEQGRLLAEQELGVAARYFGRPDIRQKLEARTCVRDGRKRYYQFHDSAPLPEMLRPKILCKDIGAEPKFWIDTKGDIVPRHSVYYIVPAEGVDIEALYQYLTSADAKAWLKANVQRAANGFYRLQSTVLRRLPVPDSLVSKQRMPALAAR